MNTTTWTWEDWQDYARRFLADRRGLAGARDGESCVGYVDNFLPVYVRPGEVGAGEYAYVWFIRLGVGRAERIVTELLPGVYMDNSSMVVEHDPDTTLVLGRVTRVGDEPLLTPEMVRGGDRVVGILRKSG